MIRFSFLKKRSWYCGGQAGGGGDRWQGFQFGLKPRRRQWGGEDQCERKMSKVKPLGFSSLLHVRVERELEGGFKNSSLGEMGEVPY